MQRNLRIKLVVSLVSAATVATTAGVGALAQPASASTPVSFTYWTSGFKTAEIQTIDNAFDKAYPGYKAVGQYISTSDEYLPKVISALKTGTYPTVLTDQNPSDLPLYAQSGKLVPLTSRIGTIFASMAPRLRMANRKSLYYNQPPSFSDTVFEA